ncbi:hypothetical protein AAG570_009795 [Ranatra chinensis]|uniref:Uncharacterized protein n=1 Tax=Ranatra chinensis TaxID=642074 RepID=A0ABD0Z780_9HEMI
MASKRRNMFHKNKKQETTENVMLEHCSAGVGCKEVAGKLAHNVCGLFSWRHKYDVSKLHRENNLIHNGAIGHTIPPDRTVLNAFQLFAILSDEVRSPRILSEG